ncbi:hypothetical protein PYW08_010509 [Mythimna loreyi]|uniref:Uncharacterized protein n=1 Tax=Mythimna loreyi TaxID=667449 RepID=A0ACC2Q6M6_9NEOP|nr:hypothetical protein PYW08_010509 [Mythimna loreyi]
MMYSSCVLTLVTLLVRSTHSFLWEIVVSEITRLNFYYNGTITHTENIPFAHYITSVSYDPVHYRVFFTDSLDPGMSISSYDLTSGKIKKLGTRESYGYYARVVYDPITQVLFWKQHRSIYSFSLNPASPDKILDGNLLATLDHSCNDIAVDSCGGYIYWITDNDIGRMRLDGSESEVLVDSMAGWHYSLAIDLQSQKIYWTETIYAIGGYQMSIESANFRGKNRTTLYKTLNYSDSDALAISKNFIYFMNNNQLRIWQLPKNASERIEKTQFAIASSNCRYCQRIATYYTLEEQIQGVKSCENVQYLIQNNSKPESTVSICYNYCLNGNCSVSAEGLPNCSCKAGYSGKRCEEKACKEYCLNGGVCSLSKADEPVCLCPADYYGDRCEIPICQDYCLQGNCSISAGEPKCSCKAGYSGKRCEEKACNGYCLNGGVCSLSKADEPVCLCPADYYGDRCEIPICQDYCLQGNCSISAGEPKCSCKAGYSGKRCEEKACNGYCLNGGVCSLSEADEPVCLCPADYYGDRCEIPICQDYCLQGNCSISAGEPKCSCQAGYSGERCEVNVCYKHCLNNGICYLNEEDEPVCECTADYEGERCDVTIIHTDADNTTQHILQDLRTEVNHLKRILQLFSQKIDEYEAKI